MFPRSLQSPKTAFFLFGPRGTGKSTWLRQNFSNAFKINLLESDAAVRYERSPELFRAEVRTRDPEEWIVVDEVQRVPKLLDEVHLLMEEYGYRRFAMTGSSARKIRRGAANLLAGRAVMRQFFPLTSAEIFPEPAVGRVRFGSLPMSVTASDEGAREDFLRAYVTTYLAEEIRAEGLVRSLGDFSRFLEVAALAAGQRTNVSNIARDASVARDTVRGYFDVLVDTLIARWLPAYRPRAKVKEIARPKFYWFDPGVLHAAAGGFDQPMPADWNGVLLEHFLLHEIESYRHYTGLKGSLGYWATPGGGEVDFVWWHGDRVVAIEAKHSRSFRRDHLKGLRSMRTAVPATTFVVYLGDRELEVEGTRVVPLDVFVRRLHAGGILGLG